MKHLLHRDGSASAGLTASRGAPVPEAPASASGATGGAPTGSASAAGEVPPSSVAMDVRIGGAWRAVMCTSEGHISWHGEYRELAEPERIVFTLSTQPPPSVRHAIANVVFAELGEGRTEMRFEQRGSLSPGQASVARYGWARSFDRLAERLAAA